MKYNVSLFNNEAMFDQEDFDSLEECREWAKGRGRYFNKYTNKFNQYTVRIYEYSDDVMIPLEEYCEE